MNPMIHVDNVNGLRYNYEYDGIGRLIRQELLDIENATHLGATEYTYDLRNNVTRIANEMGGRAINQWYYYTANDEVDNSKRYASENLPVRYYMSSSRHISYNYDSLNRLTRKTLSTETPLVSSYSYKMSNRNNTMEEGDTNSYRTTQVSTEHSNRIAYYYQYDVAGNITNIKRAGSDGAGNRNTGWTNNYRSYTYDDLSQLTSETNATTGKTYTYTYDNVGNITSKSDGTSTIAYTYGTDSDAGWSKLLTSYNGESIDYDAIGNPITYRGATMTWLGRQMMSYSIENEIDISYTYDADGLRTSKTVNGVKHNYYYVDGQLRYERNGDSYEIYYTYDADGRPVLATKRDLVAKKNYQYYLITNTRGDVIETRNGDGNVNAKFVYDAWGKLVAVTDANGNALSTDSFAYQISLKYRGYVYDNETGLYYLQSRYYDPETGRFLNADDVECIGLLNTMCSLNLFAYCGNQPVNRYDYSGLSTVYTLSNGWKYRIDPPNTSTKTKRHIHIYKDGYDYSQNDDGSPHDGSSAEPPNSVKKELKNKGVWDWDAKAKEYNESLTNTGLEPVLKVLRVVIIIYAVYRIVRLLPSFLPGLRWTLPGNVAFA